MLPLSCSMHLRPPVHTHATQACGSSVLLLLLLLLLCMRARVLCLLLIRKWLHLRRMSGQALGAARRRGHGVHVQVRHPLQAGLLEWLRVAQWKGLRAALRHLLQAGLLEWLRVAQWKGLRAALRHLLQAGLPKRLRVAGTEVLLLCT